MKNELKKMSLNEMRNLYYSLENAMVEKESELRKAVKCNKVGGYFILEFGGKKWGAYPNRRTIGGGWNIHKITDGKKGALVRKEWNFGINELRLRIANNGGKIK